jgi:uncharacterized protein YlaI
VPEQCSICEQTVPFDATVHATIHTKSDAGVVDYYVCRDCYRERMAPLFESA